MSIKLRFAPSPTGKLHVGNVRVALINYLFAKKNNGLFVLRIDDTDQERSRQEYVDQIQKDLKWLDLNWDDQFNQSDRFKNYDQAAETLKKQGRLYPCYETGEELDLKRKILLSRGLPPIYDREALLLSEDQIKAFEAEGRRPHWRFKMEDKPIHWDDMVRGSVSFEGKNMSDPVLIREDGIPLFTLTTVVDDIETKISHIIRGEDHVANTAIQVQLFEALGGTPPLFAHLPLISDAQGKGLSKRLGSLSIEQLKKDGFDPIIINEFLCKLGSGIPLDPDIAMDKLIHDFDIKNYGRATPKFDIEELKKFNAKKIHHQDFDDVKDKLLKLTQSSEDDLKNLWPYIRENISSLDEAEEWVKICFKGDINFNISDQDQNYLTIALENLPQEPWDTTTWSEWTKVIKEITSKKGKDLFMPLRLCLTGKTHGPELKNLLPLIGRDRVIKRLQK